MSRIEDTLGSLSVVFFRGESKAYASAERGIKPLIDALSSQADYSGCDAFDKIVGKAAATIYVQLRVKSVSACVMTKIAEEMLTANGIECHADSYADAIVNRKGDGLCPMESAVADIDDPDAAIEAIRGKLQELQNAPRAQK